MNIKTLAAAAALLATGCATQPPATIAVATTTPPAPITVDCLGNGSICAARLIGSQAVVTISNNTHPGYPWMARITCEFGGDQLTGEEHPTQEPVTVTAQCADDARALHWLVIINPASCRGTAPGPCVQAPKTLTPTPMPF